MSEKNKQKIKIKSVERVNELKYLHGFKISYETKSGKHAEWELASRQGIDRLKREIFEGEKYTDGAMIFATDPTHTKVVLLKEYRVSAGRYIHTLPAGLCDLGESIEQTAIREFKEETGLDFTPMHVDASRYVSVGLANERVNIVFGYYEGEPSTCYLSDEEDAEALLVDREMAVQLFESEEVTARTAYLLQYFFKLNPFFEKEV